MTPSCLVEIVQVPFLLVSVSFISRYGDWLWKGTVYRLEQDPWLDLSKGHNESCVHSATTYVRSELTDRVFPFFRYTPRIRTTGREWQVKGLKNTILLKSQVFEVQWTRKRESYVYSSSHSELDRHKGYEVLRVSLHSHPNLLFLPLSIVNLSKSVGGSPCWELTHGSKERIFIFQLPARVTKSGY